MRLPHVPAAHGHVDPVRHLAARGTRAVRAVRVPAQRAAEGGVKRIACAGVYGGRAGTALICACACASEKRTRELRSGLAADAAGGALSRQTRGERGITSEPRAASLGISQS